MENPAEKKFQSVKRTLDALNYTQPLTIESAALVERLLNDFLKTTNAFRQMKTQNEKILAEFNSEKSKIVPLSKENEKLVHENNQLHQAMIQ